MQKIIERLESLKNMCQCMAGMGTERERWLANGDALDAAASILRDVELYQAAAWTPVEDRLPEGNADVLVTVQELEPGGDMYLDIDCLIDNELEGPYWVTHHGALERVLAWAPMPPVYQPEGGKE